MNTPASQVIGLNAHPRSADRRQAEYFRRLLDDQRAQVSFELSGHAASLARYQQVGDQAGVRRLRRIVRAKETEMVTLNRLISSLHNRFGPLDRPVSAAART
jgi:hypothetical protein